MTEFHRWQYSDRWHWSKECSDYPTEGDVIISHTIPDYGFLCEECEEKEPLEKDEQRDENSTKRSDKIFEPFV